MTLGRLQRSVKEDPLKKTIKPKSKYEQSNDYQKMHMEGHMGGILWWWAFSRPGGKGKKKARHWMHCPQIKAHQWLRGIILSSESWLEPTKLQISLSCPCSSVTVNAPATASVTETGCINVILGAPTRWLHFGDYHYMGCNSPDGRT